MTKLSKYLQISDRLLLEYTYDTESSDAETRSAKVVQGNDGRLACLEIPTVSDIGTTYMNDFMHSGFPVSASGDEYFYPGYVKLQTTSDAVCSTITDSLYTNGKIRTALPSSGTAALTCARDTVKIHILTGYVFGDCEGFMLSVRATQAKNSIISSTDGVVTLQNYIFHKGNLSRLVKFDSSPLYMQSKYYDRYMEFTVPSAYSLATKKNSTLSSDSIADILNIDGGNLVDFVYCRLDDDNFDRIDKGTTDYADLFRTDSYVSSGKTLYNQGQFSVSSVTEAEIAINSNADKFNLCLYEDDTNRCIRYYPVWGEVSDGNPVTRTVMNMIESGTISMTSSGFLDDDSGDEDSFDELYGEDARKWIVVNQIQLKYVYTPMVLSGSSNASVSRTQQFSMTETFDDEDGNTLSADDLYKFAYRPVVDSVSGYTCDYISVTYTGRLVNRLNGLEVIRNASIVINDAESKFGASSETIDVENIYTWKLYNKHNTVQPVVSSKATSNSSTVYVTKFYSTDGVVIADASSGAASQGEYNLKLYESDHTYLMKLYSDSSMTTPYTLSSTAATYLLRWADASSNVSYLKPTYSENMSEASGKLEYSISTANSASMLGGNRHFAIVAQTSSGTTTLYAGKITSIYD